MVTRTDCNTAVAGGCRHSGSQGWGMRRLSGVLLLVAGLLLGFAVPASAAPSTPVATLTIHSDFSAVGLGSGGLIGGHSFLALKNISSSDITVGKMSKIAPQQHVTLGTWGNRSEHVGLWYNLEAWFIHLNSIAFATVSDSISLTSSQLSTFNKWVLAHDDHGGDGLGAATNNCSTFAAGAWNSVAPGDHRVSAGFPNTPTGLGLSIMDLPGNTAGDAAAIPFDLFGVWYGRGNRQPALSNFYGRDITRLTFDEYALGTSITNQYSARGVVFSGTPGPVLAADGSNPTSPVLSPGPGYTGNIDATFPVPVASVAFDIGYMDSVSGATVTWFSKTGKQLGSRSTTGFGMQKLVLDDLAIYRIHINTSQDLAGAAIDNFEFALL